VAENSRGKKLTNFLIEDFVEGHLVLPFQELVHCTSNAEKRRKKVDKKKFVKKWAKNSEKFAINFNPLPHLIASPQMAVTQVESSFMTESVVFLSSHHPPTHPTSSLVNKNDITLASSLVSRWCTWFRLIRWHWCWLYFNIPKSQNPKFGNSFFWDFDVLGFWCFGILIFLGFWCFGILIFGILIFWDFDFLGFW
jgi:hypothetical protein